MNSGCATAIWMIGAAGLFVEAEPTTTNERHIGTVDSLRHADAVPCRPAGVDPPDDAMGG